MKLKPYTLEIKDLMLDKKFNALKKQVALTYFKLLLILIFIFFSTFTLVNYILGELENYYALEYLLINIVILLMFFSTFIPQI
jgi:phospholipid-translocating ATPase